MRVMQVVRNSEIDEAEPEVVYVGLTREEAVAFIERTQSEFTKSGRKDAFEREYWWARNGGTEWPRFRWYLA